MGDPVDSLSKRHCSLSEFDDGGCLEEDGEITVIEIGGQRTVDSHHCSGFSELEHYFDLQAQTINEDSFSAAASPMIPRALKLFFFNSPRHNHDSAPPPAKMKPGTFDILQERIRCYQERIGLQSKMNTNTHDIEDDSVSPRSSPQRSALTTRSRRPRFSLGPVEEEKVIEMQSQQGGSQQSWTWETRYTRSQTLTFAGSASTTYFCMDFPPNLQRRITESMHSMEALAKNPLFMDTLIIDEVITFYRDAIKSHRGQLLSIKDDETNGTETSIKLEALATQWRLILRDIHNMQTHIHHLQDIAGGNADRHRARTPSPQTRGCYRQHTRQKSSEILGPQAAEIFRLQNSTCEFWARCVNMYLERTTDRIRNSTYRLRKTIPLRRRGSLPQLNRRLSNFTIEVAVQFQRNSSSVSTLVLSILSTIFFSPDGLLFAITYWWWIIATLIVPLTFIVIALWFETLASNATFLRRRIPQPEFDGVEEEDTD